MGLRRPREVQRQVIPPSLEGHDVCVVAETGSGKTAAFLAPVIQRLIDDRPPKGTRLSAVERLRGIIICPTRELADQTGALAASLTSGTVLNSGVAVGTVAISPQREVLAKGLDLLIATPGRLLELMDEGVIDATKVQIIVVDEADRLFDMGFKPQITAILARIPTSRQTMLLSATMPADVQQLADRHLDAPVRIATHPGTRAVEHVDHRVTIVHPGDRVDLLLHLLKEQTGRRMLIFCRTRRRTGWVAAALARHGITTGQLHGDRSQSQRRHALDQFSKGKLDVLVATDVGSRGLHIQGVRTVVNYDIPSTSEDLVHRSGRASHGSRHPGVSWTFLSDRELDAWYTLASSAGVQQDPQPVEGFSGSRGRSQARGSVGPKVRHETRHRPGPGRRKRASRRIDPDQKPGRGVIRPE
ncbi:MAG: DEAD/DEAH box helicase [Phycisphaerales bacterium]|nr:DEAD/DEAH box helicase [Phycisphaerales bacterium]